jgi:hypothetical protein
MVTVVLDVPDDIASRAGEYYTATLRIEPVACGTVELSGEDSVHHEVDIDSLRAPIGPVSCASGTRNRVEFSWAFRALVAGHYVATLHAAGGGSGPVALAVFDESCFEERACAEGDSAVATLPLDLEAGEVVAWVASAMGSIGEESPHFELDIERQP